MEIIKSWDTNRRDTEERLAKAHELLGDDKIVAPKNVVKLFEAVIKPGDKVNIEGDNQKQADFLAEKLCKVNPEVIHDLHLIQSSFALDSHVQLLKKGIATKVDFSYAGMQAKAIADGVKDGSIILGDIHTYLELFGRYFIDLTPKIAMVAAYQADAEGNLYTGANTEDTPVIIEATKGKQGIVIAQVNEIVDKLPRVDIPADWVDFVVKSPRPFYLEPLFTRDPAMITDCQILRAMMALKGIYAEYGVQTLNHGVGFDTAAIELLLPTYGEELGLKGKICTSFLVNPHPTLIPAIESGWVKNIHSPGGELGMEKYVEARPDVFFIGPDGTQRSNRTYAQMAGHYAVDMFIGSTLQIDEDGNSSTATANRIAGYGGAPNLGCDPKGRRHASEAWLKCGQEYGMRDQLVGSVPRGKKLVVQLQETFREKMAPGFVERLDAWDLMKAANLAIPPVMIYGDDLTHIVSEEGVAYLDRCASIEERRAAIRAIAGYTAVGMKADADETKKLRMKEIVKLPEDLGIDLSKANRNLLAAKNIHELVEWSGGLYQPPGKFKNW